MIHPTRQHSNSRSKSDPGEQSRRAPREPLRRTRPPSRGPHVQLKYVVAVCKLQRLSDDHRDAVLAFELANQSYFAGFISDRGDEFFERYTEHHRDVLADQDRGACIFRLLLDQTGVILGRFKLYDLAGSAEVSSASRNTLQVEGSRRPACASCADARTANTGYWSSRLGPGQPVTPYGVP